MWKCNYGCNMRCSCNKKHWAIWHKVKVIDGLNSSDDDARSINILIDGDNYFTIANDPENPSVPIISAHWKYETSEWGQALLEFFEDLGEAMALFVVWLDKNNVINYPFEWLRWRYTDEAMNIIEAFYKDPSDENYDNLLNFIYEKMQYLMEEDYENWTFLRFENTCDLVINFSLDARDSTDNHGERNPNWFQYSSPQIVIPCGSEVIYWEDYLYCYTATGEDSYSYSIRKVWDLCRWEPGEKIWEVKAPVTTKSYRWAFYQILDRLVEMGYASNGVVQCSDDDYYRTYIITQWGEVTVLVDDAEKYWTWLWIRAKATEGWLIYEGGGLTDLARLTDSLYGDMLGCHVKVDDEQNLVLTDMEPWEEEVLVKLTPAPQDWYRFVWWSGDIPETITFQTKSCWAIPQIFANFERNDYFNIRFTDTADNSWDLFFNMKNHSNYDIQTSISVETDTESRESIIVVGEFVQDPSDPVPLTQEEIDEIRAKLEIWLQKYMYTIQFIGWGMCSECEDDVCWWAMSTYIDCVLNDVDMENCYIEGTSDNSARFHFQGWEYADVSIETDVETWDYHIAVDVFDKYWNRLRDSYAYRIKNVFNSLDGECVKKLIPEPEWQKVYQPYNFTYWASDLKYKLSLQAACSCY